MKRTIILALVVLLIACAGVVQASGRVRSVGVAGDIECIAGECYLNGEPFNLCDMLDNSVSPVGGTVSITVQFLDVQ